VAATGPSGNPAALHGPILAGGAGYSAYRLKSNAVAGREIVACYRTMSRLQARNRGRAHLQVAAIGGGYARGDIAHAMHPHCIGRAWDAWRAARHDDDPVADLAAPGVEQLPFDLGDHLVCVLDRGDEEGLDTPGERELVADSRNGSEGKQRDR
jgi:hypothetical protein